MEKPPAIVVSAVKFFGKLDVEDDALGPALSDEISLLDLASRVMVVVQEPEPSVTLELDPLDQELDLSFLDIP